METGQVLSVEKVSKEEHVLPLLNLWSPKKFKYLHNHIQLGVKVSSLSHAETKDLFCCAQSYYKKEGGISTILHKESTQLEILQSYMHALVMANISDKSISGQIEGCSWIDKYYEDFIKKLQSSGWKTERLLSHSVVWRANWFIVPSVGKDD